LPAWYGWTQGHVIASMARALWIVMILSVLEVSLSFDNAVVNATVLKDMDEVWQKRFLTWGMVIAVYGMYIIFHWRSSRSPPGSARSKRCGCR